MKIGRDYNVRLKDKARGTVSGSRDRIKKEPVLRTETMYRVVLSRPAILSSQ